MKQNANRKDGEDVRGDNKISNAAKEFIVEAKRTVDDDNSPHTIKSAIDLSESESARNRTKHATAECRINLYYCGNKLIVSRFRYSNRIPASINSRLPSIFSLNEICHIAPGPEEGNP